MNYRHIYHAGNFADIVKHISLIAILKQLKKKEKPFAALDAFAGIGEYDLSAEKALKTGESDYGVKRLLRLLNAEASHPELLQLFLNIINIHSSNNTYPGSPLIIQRLLRAEDRLIASELHQEDYYSLKRLMFRVENVNIHYMDGYRAAKAFLPFKENRGLVFLDPPFEVKNEFDKLLDIMKIIKQRSRNIPVLIWYPIKDLEEVQSFYNNYKKLRFAESIVMEFEFCNTPTNMSKCGLLIANPPNIIDELNETMSYIINNIYCGEAKFNAKSIY